MKPQLFHFFVKINIVSRNQHIFADPLGIPIQNYHIFLSRLLQFHNEVTQVLKSKLKIKTQNSKLKLKVQNQNSKLCGHFCIYIAHVMFGYQYALMLNINVTDLPCFANRSLSHF